ncbi:MAG: hypothetical protein AB1450_11545 [Pseudomonadota bacterium]
MEPIVKLVPDIGAQQQKRSGKTSSAPHLETRWVDALFAKLGARYGHKWISAFPSADAIDLAKAEWGARLAGISGEEIRRGLDTWRNEWPPSVDEFRNACRPATIASHAPAPKALPETAECRQQRKERYREGIRVMRELLGR